MKPIKYLPAQLSPEDLEAEQKCRIIIDGRDKKRGYYQIQEIYETLLLKGEAFTLETIQKFIPQHSVQHIRLCLSEEQKLAMKRLRDSYRDVQEAFASVQSEGGATSFTEIARRAGCSTMTAKYNMTEEQISWVESNSSWRH